MVSPFRYLYSLCYMGTLATCTPTLIVTLGFDRILANTLTSVGGVLSVVVVFLFAFLFDRTQRRGLTVALAICVYLIALILLCTVHPTVRNKWPQYILWTAVNSVAVAYHPIHNTWLQLNCTDQQERSVAIAMWVMSVISGLMAGSQIFRAEDASFYKIGVIIMIAAAAFGVVVVDLQIAVCALFNRSLECKASRGIDASLEGKIDSTNGSRSVISTQKWAKKEKRTYQG